MKAVLFSWMVACFGAVAPLPATAQSAASDGEYRTSIVFGLAGDETIGIWRLVSDRWELGVDLSFAGTRIARNGFRVVDASATPGFRRHFGAARSEVSPYLYLGVPLTLVRTSQTYDPGSGPREVKDYVTGVGALLALGLDVRPVERVAIGGHAGIGARFHWGRRENDGVVTEDLDARWAGTFSSGLRIQLFF